MVTAPAALPCGGNLRLAAGPGPESGPPPSDTAGSTAVDLQLNEARLLYLAFLSASAAFFALQLYFPVLIPPYTLVCEYYKGDKCELPTHEAGKTALFSLPTDPLLLFPVKERKTTCILRASLW